MERETAQPQSHLTALEATSVSQGTTGCSLADSHPPTPSPLPPHRTHKAGGPGNVTPAPLAPRPHAFTIFLHPCHSICLGGKQERHASSHDISHAPPSHPPPQPLPITAIATPCRPPTPRPHRLPSDEVEGRALAPKPPRPPDAVQVGFKGGCAEVSLHWHIEVDDQCDLRGGRGRGGVVWVGVRGGRGGVGWCG